MKTRKSSRNFTNSDSAVIKDENEICLVSIKEPSISNSNEETINKINIEETDKEVEKEDTNADKKTVDRKYEFTFQVLEFLKKTRCGVPLTKLLTEFKNGSNLMIHIILCLIILIIFNIFLIRVILYFDMTAVWFRVIFVLGYNAVNLINFILVIEENTILVNIFNIVYLIAFISGLIYLNILFEIIKFTDLDFVHEGFFLGCLILVCLFSYLNLPGRLRLLNAFFLILFTISLVIFCVSYGFNWFIIPYYFGVLILVFVMNVWNMFRNFYSFCFEILSLTILTYFICVYEIIKVRSSLIKV